MAVLGLVLVVDKPACQQVQGTAGKRHYNRRKTNENQ